MFNIDVKNGSTTIYFLVALATISANLTQELFVQSSELWSELLCWILLSLSFRSRRESRVVARALDGEDLYRSTSTSLWLVAIGLAVGSYHRAELGTIRFWPLLTPLLQAVQLHLRTDSSNAATADPSCSSMLTKSLWSSASLALPAIAATSHEDWWWSALSLVAVVAMFFALVAFMPRDSITLRFLPQIHNIEKDIHALSLRLIFLLAVGMGLQTYVFGFTPSSFLQTTLLGLGKAITWYLVIQMTRHVSWVVYTLIGTFSLICSHKPSLQSSDAWAILNLLIAGVTLYQIIYSLPPHSRARSLLWLLLVVPLVPYAANILAIQSSQSAAYQSFSHDIEHPVQILFENAKADFEAFLQRQSKSYAEVSREYQRRYAREPPKGFETWYEFAVAHQSSIIDDYDSISQSITPFLGLSGHETLEATENFFNDVESEAWQCEVASGSLGTLCAHAHRTNDRFISKLFNDLLNGIQPPLPEVKLLVNHLDEPRVMLPHNVSRATAAASGTSFNLTILSHQPTWNEITRNCPLDAGGRSQQNKTQGDLYGLPFVTDMQSELDLCRHPEYKDNHGLFMNPTSFRLVEGMMPILSTGSPSTMGDILFPSPAYREPEFQYNASLDVEWEDKKNNLYWAGSTSGGYAVDGNWKRFHRQRFVALAQNLARRQFRYLREATGIVEPIRSTFLNARQYDVAFTFVNQCERRYCRDQRAFFNVEAWSDRDLALKSRLVFDVDGNGISGRFYKLLASTSVPLKQTLLREWHDERLKPWVHYIPVSQSMEELPELVSYLTTNVKGQQIARTIAEQGSEWFRKAFREVDQSIYLYRLVLELANLQNPDRQAQQRP